MILRKIPGSISPAWSEGRDEAFFDEPLPRLALSSALCGHFHPSQLPSEEQALLPHFITDEFEAQWEGDLTGPHNQQKQGVPKLKTCERSTAPCLCIPTILPPDSGVIKQQSLPLHAAGSRDSRESCKGTVPFPELTFIEHPPTGHQALHLGHCKAYLLNSSQLPCHSQKAVNAAEP